MFTLRSLPLTRLQLTLVALLIGMAVWIGYLTVSLPPSAKLLAHRARNAAARNDWPAAVRFARDAVRTDPQVAEAWLLIAQGSLRARNYLAAVEAWERIPQEAPSAVESRLRAADICLRQLKHLSRAERLYREAQSLAPDRPEAVDGLAQILAMEGRRSELEVCLIRLIQLDACNNFHLDLLGRTTDMNVDPQLLSAFDETADDDLAARTAHARLALQMGRRTDARKQVESILQTSAENVPAQLLLGRTLLSLKADSGLRKWLREAAANVRAEPDYWRVALTTVQQRQDIEGSMRCALEILSRDPNDSGACLALGRGLHQRGETESARLFLERAERLERFATVVSSARQPQNWGAMKQAVELAEELRLLWEAYGWSRLAARMNPNLPWPRVALERLTPRMAGLELTRADAAANPARLIERQRFQGPHFDSPESPESSTVLGESHSPLTFHDDATQTGLLFEYHNGGDCLRTGLQKMYEMTGGGVGVIDFDRDGYPDLYFPDGGDFARRGMPMSHRDRFWQNIDGETWRDVTDAAMLDDDGFGQGACVGDIDNDGFPDLLVLNIGRSVLWRNNGDGTFVRSYEFDALVRDSWSISAAIADLDGDSYSDLYLVNYLAGSDVFERVCPDAHGVRRLTCQPLVFEAAPDQLLRSLGDGRYVDLTNASGIDRPEGRGMGVVVGRITQSADLDVFVANDATANFHFVRKRPADETNRPLQYDDEAFLRGTAVDGAGRAQACMGIAANDVDGDGRLDLFVTNFEGESNTLYLQQSEGLLADQTQRFDLTASSLNMLGFGTQLLDADLDGDQDLIVANGHVNDRRDAGSKYQMPPQVFRNLASRRFQLVPATEAGAYFAGENLGRGLATLDWNRDGLPDVAISHLDRPAALLTNRSDRRGRWLTVRCVGTVSGRDAIGTMITVRNGDSQIVRQLTAGDGFAASNQRDIVLGLGPIEAETITLQVNWPSVGIVEYAGIPLDCEVVIIEGRSQAFPLARIPMRRP